MMGRASLLAALLPFVASCSATASRQAPSDAPSTPADVEAVAQVAEACADPGFLDLFLAVKRLTRLEAGLLGPPGAYQELADALGRLAAQPVVADADAGSLDAALEVSLRELSLGFQKSSKALSDWNALVAAEYEDHGYSDAENRGADLPVGWFDGIGQVGRAFERACGPTWWSAQS